MCERERDSQARRVRASVCVREAVVKETEESHDSLDIDSATESVCVRERESDRVLRETEESHHSLGVESENPRY